MMTVADIHNVTFERTMRGYRPEDVDEFLAKVAQEFETLVRARDEAVKEKETAVAAAVREKEAVLASVAKEKEDAEKKIYILAEKIEQYRRDEDNLKTALLDAHRLGESVVNEAKQKAETIVSEAQNKAAQAEQQMKDSVAREEKRLVRMQAEVAKFKTNILGLYKQHIEALSILPVPEEKKAEPAPAKKPVQPVVHAPAHEAAPAPAPVPAEEHAVSGKEAAVIVAPVAEELYELEFDAEPEQAEDGKMAFEAEPAEIVEMPAFDFDAMADDLNDTVPESFENYQGISFDS